VAVLATLLTGRVKFHSQMFGESLNANSPVYKMISIKMIHQIQHNTGANYLDAVKQGQIMLSSHIARQSYIQAINDDFLIAAAITLAGVIPIFWLHTKKRKPSNNTKSDETEVPA
jgi:DHA2 family multidrug resistance protein